MTQETVDISICSGNFNVARPRLLRGDVRESFVLFGGCEPRWITRGGDLPILATEFN